MTLDVQAEARGGPEVPPKAGLRTWIGLAVLCLPTMLATVDINVMFLALPHVSADLSAGSTQQLWIMDSYAFLITGFVVTMGTLGDRIGRRKVLLTGAAAFTLASLLAAYSTSAEMLIGARVLMGIAAATLMPSVLALISNMFTNPKEMGTAMGLWGTAIMGGVVLGPVIGGLLLNHFWWGAIFLMSVPVMGLLLITGPFLVPESRNPDAGRLDLVSVALSLAAILPLIYGLKELARSGWQFWPIVSIVVGAVFVALFLRRQRKLTNPLLDLRLFESRTLATSALLAVLLPVILAGVGFLATLSMQLVSGYSPFQVALWLLIPSLSMIVMGNVAIAVARKVRPAYVIAVGGLVAAAGMVLITQADSSGGIGTLLVGLVLVYIGGGSVGMQAPFLLMSSAPPERAGSVGGLASTTGEFGTALGVAILGLIGIAVYRTQVTVPAGVPAESAGSARESLAGAAAAAEQSPGAAGAELLNSAREAFTSGLHVVAVVGAIVLVGLVGLALARLRQVPPTGAPPAGAPEAPESPEAVQAAG